MTSASEGQFHRSPVPSVTPGDRRVMLRTRDGVPIEALYEPCAAGPTDTAIVVAHGFTGAVDRPAVRRAAGVFAHRAAVITFSFRGHGRSGGRSTVGDREVLDLVAAVEWARVLGHTRVVTVGFSMGGSVVLRHAALDGSLHGGRTEARTDAVASVSAPARWYYRGTAPMRRLHWMVTRPLGRLVGRVGLHTRIHPEDWDPVPLSPVDAVPLIAPTPLLVVHGDRDPYFPLDHPRMLAAAGSAELWVEAGMGHAENAAGDELLERIAEWLMTAGRPGAGRP
ncbi:alpha/beta fold hydrolase [Streptomyces sp. NBC_01267]|uniref:alpha/beta hydrolase n=1 Tax=unclassified Streptomyces TaxID=2593676 RepID=UPI00202586E7|nr:MULTISPECIES: alpha/beta fold hydrolase [unclassified Streptomyces]WSC21465.1 alpha/beta fold hydrolase [Streptomyces sp. NBC_01766]WSV55404.1 alpha/beta fold hydrolase [Streptomyces sp. NBC_01014]